MRGRRHRDRPARPVESSLAGDPVDGGEPLGQAYSAEHRRIEQHRTLLHDGLPRDRARHDVARSEFTVGVRVEHEPPALVIEQRRPFAAHGFGDEERRPRREHGRMELHELQVRHLGARPQCRGDPVAGRTDRVRRAGVQLPGAAGREDHGIRFDIDESVVAQHPDAADRAVIDKEVDQEGVLDDVDRTPSHLRDQRP